MKLDNNNLTSNNNFINQTTINNAGVCRICDSLKKKIRGLEQENKSLINKNGFSN
jgi:hypothetical protein